MDMGEIVKHYDSFYGQYLNPSNMSVVVCNSKDHLETKAIVDYAIKASTFSSPARGLIRLPEVPVPSGIYRQSFEVEKT